MASPWNHDFEAALREHLSALPADAELDPDVPLSSLGLDSLGSIQLLVGLEEAFAIAFPDELLTAETFRSAGSLWDGIRSVLNDEQEKNGMARP